VTINTYPLTTIADYDLGSYDPRMPCSTMLREEKNWSRIHIRDGIITKSYSIL